MPRTPGTLEKIFYAAHAYLPSYGQGADLIIVRAVDGQLWGLACEFDLCTRDIRQAAVSGPQPFDAADAKFAEAQWSPHHDDIGLLPASWEDLMNAGLADCIAGYQLQSQLGIQPFPGG
ncbi:MULTISPECIES: hypothetical protein [unclassified Pseudomonas]|uniref:hypothetical protein n=1 Tax=unclassified Pseudomonas TaxID=196821 RepID=UPI000CD0186B|nr:MULTISPECIES: hypothetical protein [unclassified Pseudomonas]POA57850.1 hypothetical protein C1889_06560 [Pseudomonas sp. FW507-12TSA]